MKPQNIFKKQSTRLGSKAYPRTSQGSSIDCLLFKIASAPKSPQGGQIDHTELQKGVCIHDDFVIFNVPSFKQYVSGLMICDATSHKCWVFPTRSHNPPIYIMLFIVNYLRKQGFSVNVLHVNEDGMLVKSVNFMKVCSKELNMTVQEAGSYNSEKMAL